MSGAFLQSTSKNFLQLRYGLDKTVTKVQTAYQDLIKDKEKIDNQCKVDEEVVDKLNFTAVFNNVSKETLDETP